MKGFLKFVGLCALISTTPVNGLDFVPTPNRFVIGGSGILTIKCSANEPDVKTVFDIIIKRELAPGANNEQTLASIEYRKDAALADGIDESEKDFVVTGSLTDIPPYLEVSMNMQKMTCNDARMYKCRCLYRSSNDDSRSPTLNATLEALVLPVMTGPLEAKKNGEYVGGGDSSNKVQFNAGDQLELTCRANIGSRESTRIQWRKSSEIIDQNFNQYNPAADMLTETDALSDNQCGYTQTSTLKYNVTASDAAYNLAFECYVEVINYPSSTVTPGGSYETKSARYYLDVDSAKPSSNEVGSADSAEPSSNEVGSAGSGNAGVIAGGVVGGFVYMMIAVLLVYFLWYRRRSSAEDCKQISAETLPADQPNYINLDIKRSVNTDQSQTVSGRGDAKAEEENTLYTALSQDKMTKTSDYDVLKI